MYRQKLVHDVCQYRNVPLATAIALVRAADPVPYWKQNIERQYRLRSGTQHVLHGMDDFDADGENSGGMYRSERVSVER